jgi:hypothetical protein
LPREKRLLVLGPSFRRRKGDNLLPAFERYDGLFFRVARKYLGDAKDVDVAVMTDDLTLVDGSALLAYTEPEGRHWGGKTILKKTVDHAKVKNESYLKSKLKRRKYSEIFISMGKEYAAALPDLAQYGVTVVFPASGGPGPKAQALKQWFSRQ